MGLGCALNGGRRGRQISSFRDPSARRDLDFRLVFVCFFFFAAREGKLAKSEWMLTKPLPRKLGLGENTSAPLSATEGRFHVSDPGRARHVLLQKSRADSAMQNRARRRPNLSLACCSSPLGLGPFSPMRPSMDPAIPPPPFRGIVAESLDTHTSQHERESDTTQRRFRTHGGATTRTAVRLACRMGAATSGRPSASWPRLARRATHSRRRPVEEPQSAGQVLQCACVLLCEPI